MQIKIRPKDERGEAELGWLHARYTFSFADYHDPNHLGFRSLKVMNNDVIEPGGGFATHHHQNMEIFTYIEKGSLEHKDSMGNESVLSEGQLQYMSAGHGVQHSEFNTSKDRQTELYQIWLQPNHQGGSPRYKEIDVQSRTPSNDLRILFSGSGRNDSIIIRQDAEISIVELTAGRSMAITADLLFPFGWVQLISGTLMVEGKQLNKADGIAIEDWVKELEFLAREDSKFLLFRLQ
jgi:hypothetical protein